MFNLNNKTVLITGSSGGIGAEIARQFHSQGAFVVLHGTREQALSALAEELKTNVAYVVAPLNDTEQVDSLIKNAEEKAGNPLDILVNNAGITRDTLFMRMKDADFDDVIQVNLRAAFKLGKDAIKGMMKRRNGRIINITSVVGVTGNPGQANYCASKAGLIGMSKAIAAEVASRGITVNCVAPGFIQTPMTDVLTDEQKEKILANIPANALGSAKDIAAAALFLASDQAGYITGQTLHVNGGMAMI